MKKYPCHHRCFFYSGCILINDDGLWSWAQHGQNIPIIDSNDVLRNPQGILSQLCEGLGVTFDQAMLDWPRGSRDSDGILAKHWYHRVVQSTGFAPDQ